MATSRQIEANRRNAQKSTGPCTVQGKAVSRFNALKSGIDAKTQVIPGERRADLDALSAEYHQRFQPAAPEERFLVDTLVAAEWQLRRLRVVEAQLWEYEMESAFSLSADQPLGQVFSRGAGAFNRLQRRIDSAERSYHRALEKLTRLQSGRPAAMPPAPPDAPVPSASAIGFVPAPVAPTEAPAALDTLPARRDFPPSPRAA
jgi:hypothetical protein